MIDNDSVSVRRVVVKRHREPGDNRFVPTEHQIPLRPFSIHSQQSLNPIGFHCIVV